MSSRRRGTEREREKGGNKVYVLQQLRYKVCVVLKGGGSWQEEEW